jgi:HAD superfamily hydrolase (TIGR01459 family)
MVSVISGMSAVLDRYDGFILDIWGVLHDGRRPYAGVLDCLARLRDAGKRTCLLSNAPRRNDVVVVALERMGIGRHCYDLVYTSGEATWEYLAARPDAWHRHLGRRLFHIGPPRDASVYQGLDYDCVDKPDDADFVVNTGIDSADETLALYEPILQRCAARGLPMICANPDLVVTAGTQIAICAGTTAHRYAELGGDVYYHGKPHAPVYRRCRELLAIADAARIVAVGDSFRTDVAGATAAGLDAVLVTGGIHRDEITLADGDEPDLAGLARVAAQSGFEPRYAVAQLRW